MKRFVTDFSRVALVVLLLSTQIWAQATAQISGTVNDQSGAVLPGVELTVTQTATGISRATITNETGSYVLPNLPVGPYRLEASLPGFRTFVQTGIVLQVNSAPSIHVVLEVGQVTDSIEVQANAALVETQAVGIGQIIENERILELPLNGRNVADLVELNGGAVRLGTSGNLNFAGSPILAVGGGLGMGAGYMLDGALHTDPGTASVLPLPFPDALEEFKVETSGLTAQHGRGTSVNAVTKSGTNEIHGDIFDFARNDLFNARSYFAAKNSTLKRHQFGGTIGGPIIQNRLFFFGGIQGTTIRQDPADIIAYVPTAAMRAGDFSTAASPLCNAGRQITLAAPFVNNRIDPSQFSPAARNIAGRLPQTDHPCGEFIFGRRTNENQGQFLGKADYQLNTNHSMFGRYMYTFSKFPHPYSFTPDNVLNVNGRSFHNIAQSGAFGDTYLIGPNTVNAFRIAVNRTNIQRFQANYFGPNDVGINIYSYNPKYLMMNVQGWFNFGSFTGNTTWVRNTTYQLSDDLSVVRGTHQLAFGVNISQARSNNIDQTGADEMVISGNITGLPISDFFMGHVETFEQQGWAAIHANIWDIGAYAQDIWKATSRVTVNYGLRWQPHLTQTSTDSRVYNFDEERFRQNIRSKVYVNAPAGFYYVGDPGYPGKPGAKYNWWKFAPRAGLAWDVTGDGRTSVRASYALTYAPLTTQWRIDSVAAPPWGFRVTLNRPVGRMDNPWLDVPGGNPFPVSLAGDTPFPLNGEYVSDPIEQPFTYTSAWNLSVQRQVASEWLISGSYIGSQAVHVFGIKPLNPGIYVPGVGDANGNCFLNGQRTHFTVRAGTACSVNGNVDARRHLSFINPSQGQYIGAMGEFDGSNTQSYHGLLTSIQRRVASGVSVNANYTWSHCIGGYGDVTGSGFNAGQTYAIPGHREADRGECDADRRGVLNLTTVAETPQFANNTLRMIAGGWRLSGIYRWSSGNPINVVTGGDNALNGIAAQRPTVVAGQDPYLEDPGPRAVYLDRNAFSQPALGTTGNLQRNSLVTPGNWQLDAALSRIFRIGEEKRLEFRAEAYNLTNSFRPLVSGAAFTNHRNSNFGRILSSREPRVMQFALKYVF